MQFATVLYILVAGFEYFIFIFDVLLSAVLPHLLLLGHGLDAGPALGQLV